MASYSNDGQLIVHRISGLKRGGYTLHNLHIDVLPRRRAKILSQFYA